MTTLPLTVSFDELDHTPHVEALNAAVGSLPMTFRRADSSENADIVAVGGPEWAARAASSATSGARGVLLVDPWPIDTSSLHQAVTLTCPVVIDSGWRHNPAVDRIRDGVAKYRRPGALLEVSSTTVPGSDFLQASVGLLDLITAVATDLTELQVVRHDDRHLVLSGRLTDQTVVVATIVATNAKPSSVSLSVSEDDGRAQLLLPDPITAASATATLTDPTGHTLLPTGTESAHRGALKRLAVVVAEGTASPDDLPRFADYARSLLDAVEHVPVSPDAEQVTSGRRAR